VKLYLQDPDSEVSELDPKETLGFNPPDGLNQKAPNIPAPPLVVPTTPAKRKVGRPRKYPKLTAYSDITVFLQNDRPTHQFRASRQKEITGLLEKGVFSVVPLIDVPKGVRLFNSRFVDEVKNPETEEAYEKSRLVVQAYNDIEKELVLTQSPTIQRVSQRLILCIAAMEPKLGLFLRDITQAYVQSNTTLNREFYVRPPKGLESELGIDNSNLVLKVLKPLYGVPKAGNHWFKTYHSHHIDNLGMDQSTYDPCLLFSNSPKGLVGLQTDDTLLLADDKFAQKEQDELEKARFLAKNRERLSPNRPIKFNGGIIERLDAGITLTQPDQCKNLSTINTKSPATSTSTRGIIRSSLTLQDQYVAQRARGAYIASMCQPEASYDLSFAAQITTPTESDAKTLNKRLQWQMGNRSRGLKFVQLDPKSLRLLAFTDASFANNKDLSSQIGYILVLADAMDNANILHWSSLKCKRVTRSVLASELYGTAHGFDIAIAIKTTLDNILDTRTPLILCTDSKSLFDCLVRLGTTQEKRLMIDIMCLRQAYERRQITEVKWIDGDTNPADAMTKAKPCDALRRLIDTNKVDIKDMGWVERQ
jgi:Reverse transcriptase (RNA-dependent DNA polymerase)